MVSQSWVKLGVLLGVLRGVGRAASRLGLTLPTTQGLKRSHPKKRLSNLQSLRVKHLHPWTCKYLEGDSGLLMQELGRLGPDG